MNDYGVCCHGDCNQGRGCPQLQDTAPYSFEQWIDSLADARTALLALVVCAACAALGWFGASVWPALVRLLSPV